MTPGTLLTLGDYYGSIAATRCFGRQGISVHFADQRIFIPGLWSKYVTKRTHSPAPGIDLEYYQWLLTYGKKNPGLFLYPTSDDMCWLIAKNREELATYYTIWSPPLTTIYNLLNKENLHLISGELGIKVPETYFLKNHEEVASFCRDDNKSYMLKPKTQIGLHSKSKGKIIRTTDNLAHEWRNYLAEEKYAESVKIYDSEVELPMLQVFYPSAANGIVSIAGFIGEDDDQSSFFAVSSKKVFQRPRQMGVGIAFEAIPLDPLLKECVYRLSRYLGYFGIFEAEFIVNDHEYLLTDFNPRYYGQMAFEVARGLNSPLLAYYQGIGDYDKFQEICQSTRNSLKSHEAKSFAHSWIFKLLLTTQKLGGSISKEENTKWHSWLSAAKDNREDCIFDANDRLPYYIDVLATLWKFIRHPRDFLRKFFLNRY